MPPLRRPLLGLAVLAALLSGCLQVPDPAPTATPATSHVVVALQPTTNPDVLAKVPALEALLEDTAAGRGLDLDVTLVTPPDYESVIEGMRNGEIDGAFMPAWPAALANQQAGAEVVLAERREVFVGDDPIVMTFYYSHYIVPKDSPYQSLEELRGKRVAYTSTTSTSGYVFPVKELVDRDLIPAAATVPARPDAFFGEILMAGGYGKAWQKLEAGEADVAVLAGDISADLYNQIRANTRTLSTHGPIPSHGVVFAPHLQGAQREALLATFLESSPAQKELMREMVSATFVSYTPTTTRTHLSELQNALFDTGLLFASSG